MIIIFDLDDTLYDEIDFVKSGLWEVSKYINPENPSLVFISLFKLFQENGSGHIFNDYLASTKSSKSLTKCIEVYRNHIPQIFLSYSVKNLLESLMKSHSLGLLTDGPKNTQKNKFNSLSLKPYFELVLFSDEINLQKPAKPLFDYFENHFSNHTSFLYIADNPKKDFITPNKMNWTTIRYKNLKGIYKNYKSDADYEIEDLWSCFSIIQKLKD